SHLAGLEVDLDLGRPRRLVPVDRPDALAGLGIEAALGPERRGADEVARAGPADDVAVLERAVRRALHLDPAVDELEVVGADLELLGGEPAELVADVVDGPGDGGAHRVGRPARAGPLVVRRDRGIRSRDAHPGDRYRE